MSLPLLTGLNPLLGPPTSPTHARFVPLSSAYSRPLRLLAFRAAHSLSLPFSSLAEGTYAWVSGPTYETPAEGRFLRAAGADVVGMSTVPEVVAARDEGMGVLVLSLVTNKVVIPEGYASAREEVEAEVSVLYLFSGGVWPIRAFTDGLLFFGVACRSSYSTPHYSGGVARGSPRGRKAESGSYEGARGQDH